METQRKIGIISCSGEEIPEGTLSRNAVRRVLEALRPGRTVTLCLPLFLAGGEEERAFARNHPVVAVDGCAKRCAKRGTEMHSGPVSASVVVTDVLGGPADGCARSARDVSAADAEAVWVVAERVAAEVDALLERSPASPAPEGDPAAGCSCSRPVPGLSVTVGGRPVTLDGLALIFDQLAGEGISGAGGEAGAILRRVKIYHEIPEGMEEDYQAALLRAYQDYRRNR
ncbi:MAG: putative zinc-binding protein [Acidobacteria bacterium]|nr:putative zinc-binding protein [Acidobacteriota bacterium]